jgi:hypothetical protein
MADKIGRNNPCLYGSGKKYRNCCMNNSSSPVTRPARALSFRFEPGSYGNLRLFMPSIACLRESTPGEWAHYFVLVKPAAMHEDADEASAAAAGDLKAAFAQREQTGSDVAVAENLRARGYLNVNDFKIAKEDDIGVRYLSRKRPTFFLGDCLALSSS